MACQRGRKMYSGELGPSELGPWIIWLLFSFVLAWAIVKKDKQTPPSKNLK